MNIVIIGVGNEYRHDDGFGLIVADRLRLLDLPDVTIADSDGEPTGLLDLWDGADLAIVADAVQAHGRPGRIYRVGMHHPALSGTRSASSHAVSLGAAADLARALGRLPRRLLLFGVQADNVEPGVGLSPAVNASVDPVVAEVADVVRAALIAGGA